MKHWYQSKTFWVNLITLVSALLPPIRDFLSQVGLGTEWVVSALAALNLILRFLTNQPLKVK